MLVIVRDGERQVGLVVDEVEDVIMADVTTMQQPMDAMRGGGVVRGVVRSGNRLIAVLDARALVRMVRARCRSSHDTRRGAAGRAAAGHLPAWR